MLPDDMVMWDQTPISFWKGSDHLTWNITKSVDDSLQTTHAGAGGTALGHSKHRKGEIADMYECCLLV